MKVNPGDHVYIKRPNSDRLQSVSVVAVLSHMFTTSNGDTFDHKGRLIADSRIHVVQVTPKESEEIFHAKTQY